MTERRESSVVREAGDGPGQRSPETETEDDEEVSGEERSGSDEGHPRESALNVKEAAKAALRQLMELTAKPAESITGAKRTEGGWTIGIEVVEDRRIPSSADILAIYEAEVDRYGDLVSYHRVRRYSRGRGIESGGS